MTAGQLIDYLKWFQLDREVFLDIAETGLHAIARAEDYERPIIVMGGPLRSYHE